jgi:hypothetical protein
MLEKHPGETRGLVLARLGGYQEDKEFADVRGDALSKRPEAERPEWQRLWHDIETVRQRAAEPAKKAGS